MLHRTHAGRASLYAMACSRLSPKTRGAIELSWLESCPKCEGQKQTTPAGGGDPASVALFRSATGRRSVADPNRGALGGGVRRPDRWVEDSTQAGGRV